MSIIWDIVELFKSIENDSGFQNFYKRSLRQKVPQTGSSRRETNVINNAASSTNKTFKGSINVEISAERTTTAINYR